MRLCAGRRDRLFHALGVFGRPAVIDGVVPPRPHHGDIFINQLLLLLEFPLDDTVQCRGATRDHEPFAEESVLHRLLQPYHVR